jgi:hypothetical protein
MNRIHAARFQPLGGAGAGVAGCERCGVNPETHDGKAFAMTRFFSVDDNSIRKAGFPWVLSIVKGLRDLGECKKCGALRQEPVGVLEVLLERDKGTKWPDVDSFRGCCHGLEGRSIRFVACEKNSIPRPPATKARTDTSAAILLDQWRQAPWRLDGFQEKRVPGSQVL